MDLTSIRNRSRIIQRYTRIRSILRAAAESSKFRQLFQSVLTPADEEETKTTARPSVEVSAEREAKADADNAGTFQLLLYQSVRKSQRIVLGSRLYRWLSEDPEPEVIVIDLRKTRTVGPVLRYLDWIAAAIGQAASHSAIVRGLQWFQSRFRS